MAAAALRRLATPSSVNAAIKQIADVMRRANYAGALQYVPELSWILFLRILDEREEIEAEEAAVLGIRFAPSLEAPFRWRDWAALGGEKRVELAEAAMGAYLAFVNGALLQAEPGP
jgi:type I restriction enzyme M protein